MRYPPTPLPLDSELVIDDVCLGSATEACLMAEQIFRRRNGPLSATIVAVGPLVVRPGQRHLVTWELDGGDAAAGPKFHRQPGGVRDRFRQGERDRVAGQVVGSHDWAPGADILMSDSFGRGRIQDLARQLAGNLTSRIPGEAGAGRGDDHERDARRGRAGDGGDGYRRWRGGAGGGHRPRGKDRRATCGR